MIDRLRPDAVFDCTVPEVHALVTEKALRSGIPVLGEKPMAETLEKASNMVKIAEETNLTYAVIQNRRYLPDIIRFRDMLNAGTIGDLTTLNADFYIGAHFGGFREEMEHVLLKDMAIHTFDQARFISGKDPVSVYCHEWNPEGSWYSHGASAQVIFEMNDGVIFNYRGSWCAEGFPTTWESSWRACGTKGTALWDGGSDMKARRVTSEEGFQFPVEDAVLPEIPEVKHQGHAGVIREFLDSLNNGTKPQTVCNDNIKSVAMVYAAIESAETGKKVSIRY